MSEMVETVARHLCRAHPDVDFAKARAYARTAIEAMREPTEAMKDAAYADCGGRAVGRHIPRGYTAMIDEALAEGMK